MTQQIQNLRRARPGSPGEAFVRDSDGSVTKITTLACPTPLIDPGLLAEIEEEYLTRYFAPVASLPDPMLRLAPLRHQTTRGGTILERPCSIRPAQTKHHSD